MFLASGKCENTLKYQYMKVFSIFKWCKLYVLRFQLFLSEVFECLLLCRRHERLQGLRILRGVVPWLNPHCCWWTSIHFGETNQKDVGYAGESPSQLCVCLIWGSYHVCIYIYISECPHICQTLYVKYSIIYIYMSKFISYLL